MSLTNRNIFDHQISRVVPKLRRNENVYEDLRKKRGRQVEAKTTSRQYTIMPSNMVKGTMGHYRIASEELEARQLFIQKLCNSMLKPTGSSGVDEIIAECHTLNKSLYALKEGDTFGDSDG